MISKSKEFYDKEVLNYHNHMSVPNHYTAQKRLFNKFKIYLKDPVLDLACGPGYLLSLICKQNKKVYANDISKEMIEFSKTYCDAIFTNQNLETIKSKIKFKTLVCSNVIYYIDKNKALKSWSNLIDKKGIIIIQEEYPFALSQVKTKFIKNKKQILGLTNPVSPDEIKTLFELNKFKFIKRYKTKIDDKHSLYCQIFEKV